jgi:hypothetical protein
MQFTRITHVRLIGGIARLDLHTICIHGRDNFYFTPACDKGAFPKYATNRCQQLSSVYKAGLLQVN